MMMTGNVNKFAKKFQKFNRTYLHSCNGPTFPKIPALFTSLKRKKKKGSDVGQKVFRISWDGKNLHVNSSVNGKSSSYGRFPSLFFGYVTLNECRLDVVIFTNEIDGKFFMFDCALEMEGGIRLTIRRTCRIVNEVLTLTGPGSRSTPTTFIDT